MTQQIRSAYDRGKRHGIRCKTEDRLFELLANNPYVTPIKREDYAKGLSDGYNLCQFKPNKPFNEI